MHRPNLRQLRIVVFLGSAAGVFLCLMAASEVFGRRAGFSRAAVGLVCDQPIHHFGDVTARAGESLVHDFELRNTADKPIRILKHVSSCSCAVVEAPTSAILPGASCTIRIAVKWKGLVGPQEARTLLITDADKDATTILALRGSLNSAPTVSPAVINFGPVKNGIHTRVAEVLSMPRSLEWQISRVTTTHEAVTVSPLLERVAPENSLRYVITLDVSKADGSGHCEVRFETKQEPLTLHVRWKKRHP